MWEAVYFDHNEDGIRRIVDKAAEIGVERVVLDDGWLQASQAISTIAGKTYTISLVFSNASGSTNYKISVGTTIYNNNVAEFGYPAALFTGTYVFSFVATSSTTYVTIQQGAGAGISGSVDSISVRLSEADRSANNKGLPIFGTITKTPIATGTDLVCYSGFSSSNYLEQANTSILNFGTGDF